MDRRNAESEEKTERIALKTSFSHRTSPIFRMAWKIVKEGEKDKKEKGTDLGQKYK